MRVTVEELREKCESRLQDKGFPSSDASAIADHYLFGELSGKRSHGISSLLMFLKKYGPSEERWEVIKDKDNHLLIDGKGNAGHLVASEAIGLVAERARAHGLALIGMRNMTSYPIPGYCAWRIAEQGSIGLVINNAPATVAAPDGKDPLLGTNPIGFAVPGTDFMLDMATATRARGEVRLMEDLGEDLPEGIAIDKDGNPTTSTEEFHALTPLGGYKGFGIALMIEVLTGALVGNKVATDIGSSVDRGYAFLAIRPDLFREGFSDRIERLMDLLGGTRVPGERSLQKYRQALEQGDVDIEQDIYHRL